MMMPLTVSFLLTGCEIKPQRGVLFCEVANPIYLSKDDKLTQESKRQVLAHDIVGERICGWGQSNRTS